MEIPIKTNREEFTLVVSVLTNSLQDLRVIFKDTDHENTEYTNRILTVKGKATIHIQVPLCDMNAKLVIYNNAIGNIPSLSDPTFKLVKCFKIPLEKRYDIIDYSQSDLARYISFCQRFCITAGWISTGTYKSDPVLGFIQPDPYYIQYLSDIMSSEPPYGTLNTPARICKDNGIIQASQRKFVDMTVPMRMCIMCHEYSHVFVNQDMEDEVEADINGLSIYLGLGFPRIDAQNAFTQAFLGAAYPMNGERMAIIQDFIQHYDESKIVIV